MKNAFEYEAELAALREELAKERRWKDDADFSLSDYRRRLADAERRNAELVASIVSLPDEFKELSGCENTAGVYACIDYIRVWCIELAKPTESGASE
ncbi:hypothetical protein D3C87_1337960 [compost metagenome]